jgi:hypothetical protein
MNKSQSKTMYWRICILMAALLAAVGLSPLVIPPGVSKPSLLGMPYSLWTGLIVTSCLVLLTYIGSRVHPGNNNENKES